MHLFILIFTTKSFNLCKKWLMMLFSVAIKIQNTFKHHKNYRGMQLIDVTTSQHIFFTIKLN